jgi:hypothetical protein
MRNHLEGVQNGPKSRGGKHQPRSESRLDAEETPARFTKYSRHSGDLAAQSHAAIALEAYHLAERRQFEPGHEQEDWLAAEARVNREGALRTWSDIRRE